MRVKKISIVLMVVILMLLSSIIYLINNILNKETKEVIVAKKFIEKLVDDKIIKEYNSKSIVEDKVLNKLANKNSQIQYSVMVGSYAVDIDKDYNVLAFSNKNIGTYNKLSIIDKESAIDLARTYISKITNENFKFKQIKNIDQESSCYNIAFYKYRNEYPYYNQEIIVAIDKDTGKLEGYSNYSIYNTKYIEDINIYKENADKIVDDYFNSINLKGEVLDNTIIGFISVSDNEMALAYVYNIKIINSNNEEETYNIYVRADTGQVLNFNLQTISKS